MFIPARKTVGVKRRVEVEDPFGNLVSSWSETEPVKVYGWETPSTDEPELAGHDRVVVDLLVLVPPRAPIGAHDRVVVGGREFEVIGEVEDAGNGPFGFDPGARVKLRRVEG